MSGWPFLGVYGKDILSTWDPESAGSMVGWVNSGAPASTAWPVANEAVYVPYIVDSPKRIKDLWAYNGATASGNVQLGLLTPSGKLLGATASTAQAGTNVPQYIAPTTEINLSPGLHYLALWCSSTSATFFRVAPGAQYVRMAGCTKQAGLTGGLPDPWVPVIVTTSVIWLFGARCGRML